MFMFLLEEDGLDLHKKFSFSFFSIVLLLLFFKFALNKIPYLNVRCMEKLLFSVKSLLKEKYIKRLNTDNNK